MRGYNFFHYNVCYPYRFIMSGYRSKSAFFADFRRKGASPTNHSWCQSSRVIALLCGIKISAVRHLVLSQCTRVTDRQTDRRTDRITTTKTALAYARAVKKLIIRLTLQCNGLVFTVRLHVMQRTVLLSEFCLSVCLSVRPSVRPSDACIVTRLNNAL